MFKIFNCSRFRSFEKIIFSLSKAVTYPRNISILKLNSFPKYSSFSQTQRCCSHFNSLFSKQFSFPSLSVKRNLDFYASKRSHFNMSSSPILKEASKEFRRLPKNVTPVHYNLYLKPDIANFTFDGSVEINLKVNEASHQIKLHSTYLKIHDVTWKNSEGVDQTPKAFTLDETEETLKIDFENAIQPTTGSLKIDFTGTLNDELCGFYRSKYTHEGEVRYNAVTQFEATDARRCFPCWDEPAIKATFDVTLIAPKNRVALSNMPVKKRSDYPSNSALEKIEYETSPIMSTYLLAIVIGEFEYVEGYSAEGVQCRVYTPPGKKEQGLFALDVTTRVLSYYKEYFNIPYPLPKVDLIAISDFSAGAMENWGLITYRENYLLVDPNQSSSSNRQYVAIVVGHELAHQWFGNLVTMEWWTHLWLNEGYATFTENLCVDHLFPNYEIWTQFVNSMFIRALELDSLKSSHPVEIPVGHPDEVKQIFDDISYNKGASVIRMLYHYIGEADFRKGMNLYLTRHQYKNAETEDLWQALQDASNKPIRSVMSGWIQQMGFPLLSVTWKQNEDSRTFTISQEKFQADKIEKDLNDKGPIWMVPINFTSSKDPTKIIHQCLLDAQTMDVTIPGVGPKDWIKLNTDAVGFYRVSYPEDSLHTYLPSIRDKSMIALDRLNMLDDLYALVQAGKYPTSEMLSFLEAYVEEDCYPVWAAVNNIMVKLNLLTQYTDKHENFRNFGRSLFEKIHAKLGWQEKENEGHLDKLLRSLVIGKMALFSHEPTLEEAKVRFEKHLTGSESVPADLRNAVYKAALSVAGDDFLGRMLQAYRDSDLQEEKDRIGRSLGAVKSEENLLKAIDFAMSGDVRASDTVFIIIGISHSKLGRELAWKYVKENAEVFRKRYSSSSMNSYLFKQLLEDFTSDEMAQEVTEFFKANPFDGTERAVDQAIENIRLNHAWLTRDKRSIEKFLETYSK